MISCFLSDLCGREALTCASNQYKFFLSDLCGREGFNALREQKDNFLSDLCGREVCMGVVS